MRNLAGFILLCTVAAPIFGLPHLPPAVEGLEPFRAAESMVYGDTGSAAQIEQELARAETAVAAAPVGDLRTYWLARIALLRATHLNRLGAHRDAARDLETVIAGARALLANGDFSEGQRLLADGHSQMMIARGFMYMVRHGDEARDAAFRALELSTANIKAYISVAGYYLNAPAVAGGDVIQGVRILERALENDPENRNDRFLIYAWLSDAYYQLAQDDRAAIFVERARRIYPGSIWLAELAAREADGN